MGRLIVYCQPVGLRRDMVFKYIRINWCGRGNASDTLPSIGWRLPGESRGALNKLRTFELNLIILALNGDREVSGLELDGFIPGSLVSLLALVLAFREVSD